MYKDGKVKNGRQKKEWKEIEFSKERRIKQKQMKDRI